MEDKCQCLAHVGRQVERRVPEMGDSVVRDERGLCVVHDEWAQEREAVIATFTHMLKAVTGDGSRKRQAGQKPPWWRDTSHEAAMFSHWNYWKHGEVADPDSGSHPLVHLAWRALAIAYQETFGKRPPGIRDKYLEARHE